MEIYIVQWCNLEESDNMGVECFSNMNDAVFFLKGIMKMNYPKDHEGSLNLDKLLNSFQLDEIIEPEQLFPYCYKISQKHITLKF